MIIRPSRPRWVQLCCGQVLRDTGIMASLGPTPLVYRTSLRRIAVTAVPRDARLPAGDSVQFVGLGHAIE